ncbi:endoribonuclease L-PSP [Fictibacillus macauensis ZFHKF-1]|uniref:Endoribonuclease L-PSP n=1 Tax=Fictibacillus macauensis ZFHKF-1 TaxID=1196324 RepID=I8UH73_9BACL|nr:RidA family protein [Fictibacillus macauensis]EIT86163.1 endoribonuclease L-PSP [Fictibacillus macauensis ZFHKF-1]
MQTIQTPEVRLAALGLQLPPLRAPHGNYVPGLRVGNLFFTSGQGVDGCYGKIGGERSLQEGYEAAQQAALNLLSVLKAEFGELSRVTRIVKMLAMINCTEDFTQLPQVADGASDLLREVFGDQGKHARSAVGMAQLPSGTIIEIELIVEVE